MKEILSLIKRPWPHGRYDLQQSLDRLSKDALALLQLDYTDPVRASKSPDELFETLQLTLPKEGRGVHQVLDHVNRVLACAPSTSGPQFFNQLFAGRDPIGVPVDMLATLANHSMYTYKLAGPLILIEDLLIRHLGEQVGYREGGGIFTPGGSLSNLAAMLCARDHLDSKTKEEGLTPSFRVYTSEESHYSVRKGAGIIGVGRDNVVMIPCDPEGRMCVDQLSKHIQRDRERGFKPMMINATAGTTVRGAFDPLEEIGVLANAEGIWFHIDGAFGGSAFWSPELRSLLNGSHKADSFTWDAHKAMGMPLTCSLLLTKEREVTHRALSESATYLFQGDSDWLNPGTRSLQCGRRDDALKLWAAWQYHGEQGWIDRITRQRHLSLGLASLIQSRSGFKLIEDPPYLNVCFEYEGYSSVDICAHLQKEQHALIGYATVHDRSIIRAAVINPELTYADLEGLLDHIEEVAPQCTQTH